MYKESFHNHTTRCGHAKGTEREYVEEAITKGMTKFGFADHSPQVFDNGYVSGIRMKPEQLADYCNVLTALKEEFKDKIELHIGLEFEYYPRHFADSMRLIRDSAVEYLIMGQHYVRNEHDGFQVSGPDQGPDLLKLYVDQVLEGVETGVYCCIAHPDMFRYTGEPEAYEKEIRRLCEGCLKHNVALEINLQGLREKRHYPHAPFWEIVGKMGNTVVFGGDAHQPWNVCDDKTYLEALEWVKKYHLNFKEASCILEGGHLLK